jgi:hypothetical protein
VAEIDLAAYHVGAPTSLAPDVWWDVTPRWTVGLVHSNASLDRIEPGASFCFRGTDPLACDHVYRGSGLDVQYHIEDWIAPRARFVMRDVDPIKPALLLGARLEGYHLTFDPYLQLGLANTDQGNRAAVYLPVRATLPIWTARAWLDTGWNSELAVWRDGWKVPVGVGAAVAVAANVDVGTELGFGSLIGPQNTPKERVLFVFVTTRWQP